MRNIIVYKGKYGATAQYARWLGQDLQAPVLEAENVVEANLNVYDNIIIASSVYVGKLQVKSWINRFADLLAIKNVFFLIVCGTPAEETAKAADIVQRNIPVQLIQPDNIYFARGRLIKKNLSLPDLFTLKIGALMQKDPADRANMLRDFDEVNRENLYPLVKKVQLLKQEGRILKMV